MHFISYNVFRLEKHATSRESLLLKTKQNQDGTTKALAEAEKRNQELMKSSEDSDKKISLLEDSVNRFDFIALQIFITFKQPSNYFVANFSDYLSSQYILIA